MHVRLRRHIGFWWLFIVSDTSGYCWSRMMEWIYAAPDWLGPFFCAALAFLFLGRPGHGETRVFPAYDYPLGSGTASIICVFSFLSLFVCVIFPRADVVACPCFSFLFIRHRPEGLKCFFFCWSPLRSHRHERDWRLSFLLFLKRKASISSSWVMHWSSMIYAVLVAMPGNYRQSSLVQVCQLLWFPHFLFWFIHRGDVCAVSNKNKGTTTSRSSSAENWNRLPRNFCFSSLDGVELPIGREAAVAVERDKRRSSALAIEIAQNEER